MPEVPVNPVDQELILSGPLTLATVAQTMQRLRELLAAPTRCVIHAAEVTQLDGAGAQLLYAFVTESARRGLAVRWASASLYLEEAARMLGMERCLGLVDEDQAWRR